MIRGECGFSPFPPVILCSLLSRRAVRMGQHAWLLLATIITELLVIIKWSRGLFTEPMPGHIKIFLSTLAILLVAYPTIQVSIHCNSTLFVL